MHAVTRGVSQRDELEFQQRFRTSTHMIEHTPNGAPCASDIELVAAAATYIGPTLHPPLGPSAPPPGIFDIATSALDAVAATKREMLAFSFEIERPFIARAASAA